MGGLPHSAAEALSRSIAMSFRPLLFCWLALTASSFTFAADGETEGDEAPVLRVMSFNLRYGTASDGENRWERRREFLVETIRAFSPDLLGTQETLAFQRDYLAEQLEGYEAFGAGRDDGGDRGEMSALFYRSERFEKLSGGHFWLSETPEKPGSRSWDSSLPRMVTWVELHDRRLAEDSPSLWFFNTHFDHRGPQARLESAKLLRGRALEQAGGGPLIVTGDFNAGEGSEPYRAFFATSENENDPAPLLDTYRLRNPERHAKEGTFSGFSAENTGGARIDWIAVSPAWEVLTAEIDRTARDGRTPSDHFPVTAVLRLTK